jgi:hypothetical protein
VPGAAATLTRGSRTPIPTPTRDVNPSPAASPSPVRSPSPLAAASPKPTAREVTQEEIDAVERQMAQVVASPDLPDIEALLLDQISLATPAGGQVLDRDQAATWLRDHAGPGITVTRVEPNVQTVLLEVVTEGWPANEPLEAGRMSFNLRRYNANGRQDDSGEWKVDVIAAE